MTEPARLAYSIDEAADALSLSRSTVKELVYTGEIKKLKVGRRVVIPHWALVEFLSCSDSAAPSPDD